MSGSRSAAFHSPRDETARLEALRRYGVLDSGPEEALDQLVRFAAEVCASPAARLDLVDEDRVWIKAAWGRGQLAGLEIPRDSDFFTRAVLEQPFFEIWDADADPMGVALRASFGASVRAYASAVLETPEGHRIGTLGVLDTEARRLSKRQKESLGHLAGQVIALLELRRVRGELEVALREVDRLATMDALTGLLNRRACIRRLVEEIKRARRYHQPLAVVVMDLDHAQAINEQFGHAMGDAILRNLGRLLRTRVRSVDAAARMDGEELILVLGNTDLEGARTAAENLRVDFSALEHREGRTVHEATLSFGVAQLIEADDRCEILLRRAGAALRRAKAEGRNRVVAAT